MSVREVNTKNKPKTSAEIRQGLINKYKRPLRVGGNSVTGNNNSVTIYHLEERADADLPANTKLRSVEDKIKDLYGTMQVKACKWYRRNDKGNVRLVDEVYCLDDEAKLIVHNGIDHDRVLCGKIIPKRSFLQLQEKCEERPRLFLNEPTVNGKDQPPIVIRGPTLTQDPILTPFLGCDIPCKEAKKELITMVKTIEGTRWKFLSSMESSGYYSNLAIKPQAHKFDLYYATTSFNSEIPLPYYSDAEYNMNRPAVNYDKVVKGASFIARNCGSNNNREKVVTNLTAIMRVDSLSDCLRNANPPHNMSLQDKIAVQREYLFHLAFENTCEDDYITEKLWGTLESGTLPVYYGAPNVKDHAPPNSIISWHDFNDTTKLGEYLREVAENRTLYESYHAWRSEPLPLTFRKKYGFTQTHSTCRMCRWAYAKKHGFSWNHTTQTVQDLKIPRHVCTGSNGLVTHPIRESWYKGHRLLQAADENGQCDNTIPTEIRVESFKRTVWSHDGIADLIIEGTGEDGTLQLEVPIKAKIVRKSSRHFEAQNDVSRVTILSHWMSNPTIHDDYFLSIPVSHKGEMRVRIILEDVDTFHAGGQNETTYFGVVAARDFFEPLEFFWALNPEPRYEPLKEIIPQKFDDDLEGNIM